MKRLILSLLMMIPLAGFAVTGVYAYPVQQSPELAFTLGQFTPAVPNPGQEVVARLTPTAAGGTIEVGSVVKYEVVYENSAEGIKETAKCKDECSLVITSAEQHDLKFYAPAKEGTYTLVITLRVGENGAPQRFEQRSLVVETALPSSVAQLFAGLGLFAAVMAIMALGTEVLIEFGKLFLGLKAKVSAMEALDQMKSELPGQLNQLGVDDQTIHKYLDSTFQGMEKTLKPVSDWAQIQIKVQNGQFAEAFSDLINMQLITSATTGAQATLDQLKPLAIDNIERGMDALAKKLPISQNEVDRLKQSLAAEINLINVSSANQALKTILEKAQSGVLKTELEWSINWLQGQAESLTNYGKDYVLSLAEKDVFKTLKDLGFDEELVQPLRQELSQKIEVAGSFVQTNTNRYLGSVKGLLAGVEDQRHVYQSPARKIWRRLRKSEMPLPSFSALVGLVQAFFWLINWPILLPLYNLLLFVQKSVMLPRWVEAFILFLVTGLVLWLGMLALQFLIPILIVIFSPPKMPDQQGVKANHWKRLPLIPNSIKMVSSTIPAYQNFDTLGYFLRHVIERAFNYVLGRESTIEKVERYGEVSSEVTQTIENITPATLARVLLEREEKHQDEETSRVRIIRVISIFVGTYLAYKLQIDAAVYLNYAVPGIETQINSVNLNLNQFSTIFPKDLTVGMILTGLAASAGSKFWRDLLGRLQSSREQAENVAKLVNSVKQMVPDNTNRA